ncbi:beta strand repeat-containing protein [Lacipirellula parvula]|uniref:Ice-binding protein C-terminal domain-containing protein n=1 Tax=Lacipirellula parvula TaxID=2650471 RepID=A0A5K7XEA9_9BACT|nr:PEP-CTERM sorting domain-containing protein [Lacipirellula parvula]BBO35194.1 hypothetical protein PLANPX_4806 [Lacipirellula parvula]
MTSSRLLRAGQAFVLSAIFSVAVAAVPAHAVTIDFESPTYSNGTIVGSNGWNTGNYIFNDPFFGGAVNGTVDVTSSSPLAGGQSLRYTQTSVPAGAGTTGGSDIAKGNVINIVPGVAGTDLTLSYKLRANQNGVGVGQGGLYLNAVAGSGGTPIFAEIVGSDIIAGTTGPAVATLPGFTYFSGDVLKMTYEVDFDASTYNLIVENLTFGGDAVTATYGFFIGFDALGPEGSYDVAVGAILRSGVVEIDDIQLTAGVGPSVTDYAWGANASGSWTQATNWAPAGVPGAVPGRQHVVFGNVITSPQTVYTTSTRNVNSIEFASGQTYAIAGTGSIALQTDNSGAPVAPVIRVTSGSHQIQVPVSLVNSASVIASAGASIDFNNEINLNGNTLTLTGNVWLNHSTVGGGTVVNLGALATAQSSAIGGDLVSQGALLVSADENGADFFNVLGDATLSGIVDIVWSKTSLPTGAVTILTAGGQLDASGLALSPEDARSFALNVDGNNLTLTFLGVTVPEPTTFGVFLSAAAVVAARGRRKVRSRSATCVLAASAVLGAEAADAAVVNFESPAYTSGAIIGQQGWIGALYLGGASNGTVTVSPTSPLSGSQSVLYQQANTSTFGADVARPFGTFGVEGGTDAFDLTATALVRVVANGAGAGSAGFFLGEQGRSPIFARIDGVGAAGTTSSLTIGDGPGLPSVGSYIADHVVELTLNVDLDNQNYEVLTRDVTAGGAAVKLNGSGPNGRFAFFGGAYGDDGDGKTYTFDTTLLLRGGTARVDNFTTVGDDFTQAEWNGASGAWGQATSWIPRMIPNVATGNSPIAVFGTRANAPRSIFTNTTQTVNGLRFDNANKYAIGGVGSIVLKANTVGGTVNPTINAVSGSHELQVPVTVQANTAVSMAAGSKLDVNSVLSLGASTLTVTGQGELNLNVGVTGGGTITNSGVLGTAGTTPFAATLNSTGTLLFDIGASNLDFFNITGNATLSGLVDIRLEPGFTPAGSYTLLTVSGTLSAPSLALDPSDASGYTLGVVGKSLVLTVGGSTVIPGDFNGNGVVDGADLTKWKADFGAGAGSDANSDGRTDGGDFLIWQRNYGRTSATTAAAAVPEPSTVLLGGIAVALTAAARRRRRS